MLVVWEWLTGASEAIAAAELTSNLPVASAACLRAVAIDSAAGFETGCQGYSRLVEDVGNGAGIDSSSAASVGSGFGPGSFSTSNREALTAGIGDGGCCGGKDVDTGLGSETCGGAGRRVSIVLTGREDGCAAAVALAGFAASVLRSNPRATRSVPLDCSTLIGFVRTRLAPMRNALATPAWPSTTATASDD